MKRFLAAGLLLFALAPFHTARAEIDPKLKTIVGLVATALGEPALNDALPLIDCVRLHGAPACVNITGVAESQGKQAVKQFVPTDPIIQSAVAIISAAYKNDWLTVLELTGTDVLIDIACHAGLTAIGPLKPIICDGPLKQVSGLAKPLARRLLIFATDPTPKNFLALVEQGADPSIVCAVPIDFPGKA